MRNISPSNRKPSAAGSGFRTEDLWVTCRPPDVCAAHGDRAAVSVDVDAQGSSLREDESHFPLNARVLRSSQ